MTAVWLIILTIIVCASVPALLIWLTTYPHTTKMLIGIKYVSDTPDVFILSMTPGLKATNN